MNIKIQHQEKDQVFMAEIDGKEADAELSYSIPIHNVLDFQHTYVAEEFRGKGIADELAKEALAYARENGYQIIPSCRFMAAFVHKHDEYQDLLYK